MQQPLAPNIQTLTRSCSPLSSACKQPELQDTTAQEPKRRSLRELLRVSAVSAAVHPASAERGSLGRRRDHWKGNTKREKEGEK